MAQPGSGSERSVEQVEAELAAARIRLAGTVDELADAMSPQEIARRQVDRVKAFFLEPDGSVRGDRIAKAAGAVAGLATLRSVVRRHSK